MAIVLSLMQSLSSLVVWLGLLFDVLRWRARSVVMRSMSGWILCLLISNQSRVGFDDAIAVAFAASNVVSLNTVYSSVVGDLCS